MKIIKINFSCDEGCVADELRHLANYIEESEDYPSDFETYNSEATIWEEEVDD